MPSSPAASPRHRSAAFVGNAFVASLRVDALEQLAAEFAPGLDRAQGLMLSAAVDASAAVQLGFGKVLGQVDPPAREAVSTVAHSWLILSHPRSLINTWVYTVRRVHMVCDLTSTRAWPDRSSDANDSIRSRERLAAMVFGPQASHFLPKCFF